MGHHTEIPDTVVAPFSDPPQYSKLHRVNPTPNHIVGLEDGNTTVGTPLAVMQEDCN